MAMATTQNSLGIASGALVAASVGVRRRQVSRADGRGIEVLGHAIEYLSDEAIDKGCDEAGYRDLQATLALLMRLNREIYFACPYVPTFGERLRLLLHHRNG